MTIKGRVAEFIRSSEKTRSYKEWKEFQEQVPEIRLKKAAPSKALIQVDGKSGFIDPESWLANYEAGQKTYLRRALIQAKEALSEEDINQVMAEVGDLPLKDDWNNGFLTCFQKMSVDLIRIYERLAPNQTNIPPEKRGATFNAFATAYLRRFISDDEINQLSVEERIAKIKEIAQVD
jgi:hypothetical protein